MVDQLDHFSLADALIPQTILGGFGGFGTSVLATLDKTYFPAGALPEGIMAFALDTCDQNPYGQRVNKGQVMYRELEFQNPAAALEEMLRQHPEWAKNLDPERLRFDRVRIATSGVLKHHARLLATALRNRALLDQISDSVQKTLSDQTNPRLNHGLLETIWFAGGAGGTGTPLAEFMGLRAHARATTAGLTAWRELWLLGPGNYPPHQVMTRWYQINFATEIKFLSRVVGHGTMVGDPRFNPVLPGFEDLLEVSAGAGRGRLLPGAFDHIMVFDPKNTKGKTLPLEALFEMMAGCAFWRSRLPMLSALIREFIIETRDKRAEAEVEEGVSYCFGGVGGRFIQLHPQLPAIMQYLVQHQNANAILAGRSDAAVTTINFNLSRLEEEAANWRSELNRHELRLSSPERLSATLAANARSEISRMFKRIEDMEEGVRAVIDERNLVSAAAATLQSELASAVNAAKRQLGLRSVQRPLSQIRADIAALVKTPTHPLTEGWKDRIWQLAEPILPDSSVGSQPDPEPITLRNIGIFRALWLNITERLTRKARQQAAPSARAVTNHPALPVVAQELLTLERAMRDYMIVSRQAEVAAKLVAWLDGQLQEQQIFAAQKIAAEKLEAAQALLSSQRQSTIHYTVQPSLPWLLAKTEPSPEIVRQVWERLESGMPMAEAIQFESEEAASFPELVAADSELIKFLRWSIRDIAPHVSVKADEVAEVPEQYFLVFPEELAGYIDAANLHLVGPWIKMPVAGLQAIIIYAMAYGLPARALQSAADCEPALREATDAEQYECSLFPEWRRLPSVFAADRRQTEEIVAAAMLLHADINQGDLFPLRINGVDVVGEPFSQNPCPFQQDGSGNYQVVVTVPGGQTHFRPLRTDSFSVAVDLVNERKAQYLDPLRVYLAKVAATTDYLGAEVLKDTIAATKVWIQERTIALEDQDFAALGVEKQKVAAAEAAVLPTVVSIHRALARFVDRDWVAHYKRVHEGKTMPFDTQRRQVRRRIA